MINSKEKKIIKIFWEDAVIYKRPFTKNAFSLKKKTTEGEIFREEKEFIIIKNPKTFSYDTKNEKYMPFVAEKKITFFYIPRGMITKIEEIKKWDINQILKHII